MTLGAGIAIAAGALVLFGLAVLITWAMVARHFLRSF